MATVLVTGAGGYVGSGLLPTLADDGWDVRALNRKHVGHLGMEQAIVDLAQDSAGAAAACEGVDVVVHLAGENEVVAARNPAFALGGTVLATERLVEAVAAADVKRFVYMSTVHVYGARMTPGAHLTEDLRPEPRSPYAIARLASEHLAAALEAFGIEVVVLRLTNSLGAPAHPAVDRWSLLTNDLARQGALTGRLRLRSSGVQSRDFIALDDVRAITTAACRFSRPILPTGVYNLGSGDQMTVRELAGLVQDAFEHLTGERPPLDAPDPAGDAPEPYRVAVEGAARHGLGARTPIADAVEETVRFCMEHKEALPR